MRIFPRFTRREFQARHATVAALAAAVVRAAATSSASGSIWDRQHGGRRTYTTRPTHEDWFRLVVTQIGAALQADVLIAFTDGLSEALNLMLQIIGW